MKHNKLITIGLSTTVTVFTLGLLVTGSPQVLAATS